MSETGLDARSVADIERLTAPLSEGQMRLMWAVFHACQDEEGKWPLFGWLQDRLDQEGLDAQSLLASFPSVTLHPYRHYTACAGDLMGRPTQENSEVAVTLLGLWHLSKEDRGLRKGVLQPLLGVVDRMARIRAAFTTPMREIQQPEVAWHDLRKGFILNESQPIQPQERTILAFLRADQPPGLLFVGNGESPEEFKAKIDRPARRFGGIATIEDYLARRLAGRVAPAPVPLEPELSSPLGLVAALDYFNVVWRLSFNEKSGPLTFPSAERLARLSHDVTNGDEFQAATSALGDLIGQITISGVPGSHPCDRIEAKIKTIVNEEAHEQVTAAVDTLRAAQNIRHTGQHSTVSEEKLRSWGYLGIGYPPADWGSAWTILRARVVTAVDALREELSLATNDDPESQ